MIYTQPDNMAAGTASTAIDLSLEKNVLPRRRDRADQKAASAGWIPAYNCATAGLAHWGPFMANARFYCTVSKWRHEIVSQGWGS